MDRGFTVDTAPEAVWPWLVQLGKRRAGWYLPHRASGCWLRVAARYGDWTHTGRACASAT